MQSIMTVLCLAILAWSVLIGFLRRSNRTLFRLVTLLISAALAFVAAKSSVQWVGPYLNSAVQAAVQGNAELAGLMEDSPVVMESLLSVVQMLFSPIFFLIFYLVLKTLLLIVHKIICRIFRIRGPRLFGRIWGAAAGLLCGVVGLAVFVVPVCGYADLVGTVAEHLYEAEDESSLATVMRNVGEISRAPIAATVYEKVGAALFDDLTTAEFDGESVHLKTEVVSVLSVLDNVKVLGKNEIKNYGQTEVEAISGAVEGVEGSSMLSHLAAGFLSCISNAWLENDSFFGVARPATSDGNVVGLLNGFLRVFSTSTHENIGQDLGTFADMFGLLVKHEMFSESTEKDAFMKKLTSPGVLEEFYDTLSANPRMAPVKAAIADIGVRVLLEELCAPDDLKEEYTQLLDDVVQSIRISADENGNVDSEALKAEIGTVLAVHEIAVDDAAVKLVSDGLSETFTPDELQNLSAAEMVDKVVERFGSAEILDYLQDASNGATDGEQSGKTEQLPDGVLDDLLG